MCTGLESTRLVQPITQKECVPAFYNANFVCAEFDINMLGTQNILNICNHQHVKVYFFTSLNQVRTSLHARNKHSYINCYVLLRLAGTWYKTRNQQQEDIMLSAFWWKTISSMFFTSSYPSFNCENKNIVLRLIIFIHRKVQIKFPRNNTKLRGGFSEYRGNSNHAVWLFHSLNT